jgi:rRNA maturation endonuclease Nob1
MKILGYGKTDKVDHLVTKEMLDRESQRKLQKFLEETEMAIFTANREVMKKAVPELTRDSFMAFAVRVAEARARYLKIALELSANPNPSSEDIARLKAAREANDELLHAFEATKRVIERGYTLLAR